MKADHDLDTTVTEGSLDVIRGRYSIPVEFRLHVPQPRQRPYSSDAPGMCISVDALEAGLLFPLHPLIEECLRWWRISPSQVAPNSWCYLIAFLGKCRGLGIFPTRDFFMTCFRLCKSRDSYYLTARVGFRVSGVPSNNKGWKSRYLFVSGPIWGFRLDWSTHPIDNASPYLFEEEFVLVGRLKGILSSSRAIKEMMDLWLVIFYLVSRDADQMDLGDLRGMPKMSSGNAPSTRVKVLTRRHKSRHDEGESRSHSKDKKPAALSEEPDTPVESDEGGASPVHHRPRSMKDLFKTKVHKDNAGYYTIQMSDLGHQDPDKEMKARYRGLNNSTKVWNDSSAAEEFERGLLHPQLARELYTLPFEVLLARAAKEMVLVSSRPLSRYRKFSFCRALINYCSVHNQHFQIALFDRVHDAGRLITFMDYQISQLKQELDTLKSGGGQEAVAKAEERASELAHELEKTKRERDEALLRLEASEKDLSEVWSNLAEV
ncbi:hypothetical protein BHM03_00013595 [Ensete ventricosum]|uniref:Transposase (putative) gypsy type domain-containing protein n=1 Tax=Ensete ventricosum TaxID=4639 RepID=A0A445MDU5_ENSVE|nr:hypothetical protein BHM03_00013595 [Ensete ventricosum]